MTNDENNYESVENLIYGLKDHLHLSVSTISAYAEEMLSDEGKAKAAEHILQCKQCRQLYDKIKKEIEASNKTGDLEQRTSMPEMSDRLRLKVSVAAKINSKRNEIAEKVSQKLLPRKFWPRITFVISSIRNRSEGQSTEYNSTPLKTDYAIAAFDSDADIDDDQVYDAIEQVISVVDILLNLLSEKCDCLENLMESCKSCSIELLEQLGDNQSEKEIFHLAQEAAIESFSA